MFDESPSEAWHIRYGSIPPDLPDLSAFLSHRSVRHYEDRPIPDSIIRGLVAAAQSAATSSNLQLWSIVSVQDADNRAKIAELCGNQDHVRTCGHFFAFLADVHRVRTAAHLANEPGDGLDYTEFFTMAVIDAALACERMVCAAESLGLGICYIGGLRNDPEGVKQLLGLPEGTFGVFGLCLGWPSPPVTAEIKPRLAQEAIWFQERYADEPKFAEYDNRMRDFYVSQHMKGEATWSMRSGRRVGTKKLTGREVLMKWLQGQGFLRR
ncbi:MAG: NADPH-dependent oxidoreductase [Fimbriimonas sp.]|nr:NADPH-dependent oxidoreductase [Fimbriimonas sp.]